MALLASGEDDQAKNVLSEARNLGEQDVALHEKMMGFLRDSTSFFESLEYSQGE